MKKKGNAKIVVATVLVIVAFISLAIAQPLPVTVCSTTGVMDESDVPLLGDGSETSDLIQLIDVGLDGVINPPDGNGNPTGDDSLICDIRIGEGYPFNPDEGKFSHSPGLEAGTVIYCRAWNDATTTDATYYGDSGTKMITEAGDYDFGTWSTNTFFHEPPVNEPPVVGTITAPIDPVHVSTEITASASFTDPDTADTHTAVWDWGDGTTSEGTVTETDGSGSVTGSHTYANAGVYTITLTVTDDDGESGEQLYHYVVVYDPEGGFVTGGGWINSPAGAYMPDETLTGKANFGFVSKYKKGADVPTGQTEFRFEVADLNFHSDVYEWLVIAGSKAMYKGDGKINGAGNYGFMLSAIDADLTPSTDVDLFQIRIWDKDNGDTVVYDNQMDAEDDADPTTAIGGGSIKIHKSK